ncbi:PREDICTED: uncharacterized protein LOC106551331 [Thamnophis sirtalis]|uniref:Uncharacterized protein LOC106551331 n=1 Tax=Thamnophis sirtalis TaxID=35019 RepID=A0A6I9YKY6_9SAUR|nr:PREDICTED: uncharacterized protein LOC106551331 [Thamnophis sirtalis]XP_013924897.1 PREDICTED: uncharacterized protein LOC106551331 [Thamnophis sirtalis]XP_013924898.1 PREDICTED: uncharacterized protein LOC106551331 [Thamnophis sirtalis]XP_013924899.1 PREDICTED: uncharacterized protein LOC106551331 [Thamnophis sirtalis]
MAIILSFFKKQKLLSKTHRLDIDSLNEVKNKWKNLGMDEGMGKCFKEVMKNFPNEPSWVMKNAQMVLKGDDGKVLSFASGKKEWKINVSAGDYKYHVKAPSKSGYLARLRSRLQPLSTGHLEKVKRDLETFGPLTQVEKSCFELVLQRFPQKPSQIQNNAQIKFSFDMDGENVEYVFISGEGDYKLDVTHSNGQPQYRELHTSLGNKLENFSCSLQTLDVGNLRGIKSELAQLDLLTDSLKSCFNILVDKLPEYPGINKNLQIDFTCYEQGLSVNSEDWKIIAQCKDGKVDFNFESQTWDMFLKQNFYPCKTHELTVEKLEGMRTKVRNLLGVPQSVHDRINKALDTFRKEISCLQKNARLIIRCDQGEMVFKSGKGENIIDTFNTGGVIHCKIYRTLAITILMFIWRLPKHIPDILTAVRFLLPCLGCPVH